MSLQRIRQNEQRDDGNNKEESVISCQRTIYFFFQAEDGIRDLTVTGVQTCALPILRSSSSRAAGSVGTGSGPSSASTGSGSGLPLCRCSATRRAISSTCSMSSGVKLDRKSVV